MGDYFPSAPADAECISKLTNAFGDIICSAHQGWPSQGESREETKPGSGDDLGAAFRNFKVTRPYVAFLGDSPELSPKRSRGSPANDGPVRTSSMEASRSASIASPRTGRPSAAAARRLASAALGVYAKPAAASILPVDCGAAAAGLRAERRFGVTSCAADRAKHHEAGTAMAGMD